MITAMEIRNYHFKKKFRGYDQNEVKAFLERLAQDYEKIYADNSKLKENIQQVQYELERYRKLEETMNNSLILAQKAAEEVKSNAQKEAALYLEQSKQHVASILMVYQEIVKRLNIFNVELRAQLTGEIDILDKNQRKIDELSQFFYGKDLKDLMENLEKITTKDDPQCSA